jgi:hypothetical protein
LTTFAVFVCVSATFLRITVANMAKKKGKKTAQKPADVAPPPAAEDPPANDAMPEVQQQWLAPPPEPASDEVRGNASTPVAEQTLGAVQVVPDEDEAPTAASDTFNIETASSIQPYHAEVPPALPEVIHVSTAGLNEHTAIDETKTRVASPFQLPVVDAGNQVQRTPPNVTPAETRSHSAQESTALSELNHGLQDVVQLAPAKELDLVAQVEDLDQIEAQPIFPSESLMEPHQSFDEQHTVLEAPLVSDAGLALQTEKIMAREPPITQLEEEKHQ